jgi:hypothetical protein
MLIVNFLVSTFFSFRSFISIIRYDGNECVLWRQTGRILHCPEDHQNEDGDASRVPDSYPGQYTQMCVWGGLTVSTEKQHQTVCPLHVHVHVCARRWVCVCTYMYVCMYVCMYACVPVCVCMRVRVCFEGFSLNFLV